MALHLNPSQFTQRGALDAGSYLPSDNPASLVAWFRKGIGVTSSGGFVSQWDDQSGNGNHLKQATGSKQPAYDGSAILTFDGSNDNLKCTAFTLNQPETICLLVSSVSHTLNQYYFDGNAIDSGEVQYEAPLGATIAMYAGNQVASQASPSDGAFFAMTAVFNGASSSLKIGSNAAVTGNAGVANMGGFTLGGKASQAANFSNIAVKEVIIRNVSDAAIIAADQAYLQTL